MNNIEQKLHNELSEHYEELSNTKKLANNYNLNLNQNKFGTASVIGAASIIPIAMTIIPYLINLDINYLITTISLTTILSSATIGTFGQIILNAIYRKFYKIPILSNQEYLEETTKHKINEEIIKSKISHLETVININEIQQNLQNNYSCIPNNKYNFENLSLTELQEKNNQIVNLYNEKLEELEILITKKYLRDNFKDYRTKSNRIKKIITTFIPLFATISIIVGLPVCADITNQFSNITSINDLIKTIQIAIMPAILSFPISAIITHKNNQEYRTIFNKFNQELNDEALAQKTNKQELEIDNLYIEKIKELNELRLIITNITNNINNYLHQENNNEQHTLEHQFIKNNIEEETKQHYPITTNYKTKKRIRRRNS